jgi:hypothetical protein
MAAGRGVARVVGDDAERVAELPGENIEHDGSAGAGFVGLAIDPAGNAEVFEDVEVQHEASWI